MANGRLTMTTINFVYTLRQAAQILDETEDMLCEASIGMLPEDGCLTFHDEAFSQQDWAITTAFTDEGVENLPYMIDTIKASNA